MIKSLVLTSGERCHYLKLPMFDEMVEFTENDKGKFIAEIDVEEQFVDDVKRLGETGNFKVTNKRK